jgi:hypothetical protein
MVARTPAIQHRRGAQVLTATGFAIGVLLFSFTGQLVIAIPILFVAGWMSAAFMAINQTTIQLGVDDNVRGRVLSIYLLTWGMLPVGQLAVGALAGVIGTPMAMAVSCVAAIACIALIAVRFPLLTARTEMLATPAD